jgi:hypothetical protein
MSSLAESAIKQIFVLWDCTSPAEVQDLTSHCLKKSSLIEEWDCMEGGGTMGSYY